MQWGALGSIAFQVSSNYARSVTELSREHTWKYAEHEIAKDKSRLQWLGRQLDKITFKGKFFDWFCDPKTEIDKLIAEADKKEPLVLVIGNETLGEFVIEKIQETWKNVSAKGKLRVVEFEVTLKEYY